MTKVALVITRFIVGGAQLHVLDLANRLRDRAEVFLVTGPSIGPEGDLLPAAAHFKPVIVPSMRRAINPVRDALAYRDLVRVFRDLKPDVVHTHSSKAGILGRRAAAKAGVPAIVHTVHGMPWHRDQSGIVKGFYARLERGAARHAKALICVSESVRREVLARGIAPAEKCVVIPCGVDFAPAPRSTLGLSDDAWVVMSISRLAPAKGHDLLLDAAAKAMREVPTLQLIFVGDGSERRALERKAERMGLGDHLIITGVVDHAKVPGYLSRANVVAHASTREGLPLTIVEAAMAGVPVVAFDLDGAREVVRPGETGLLTTPDGLADALVEAWRRESELREAAGRRAEELRVRFDPARAADRVFEVYLRS